MPDAQQRTTVSREKVEQLAAAVREMFDLKAKQAITQAQLIRWCVWALRTAPEGTAAYRRAEGFAAGAAARRKHLEDQKLALLQLEWLATKLEDQGKPSGNLTQSIEG